MAVNKNIFKLLLCSIVITAGFHIRSVSQTIQSKAVFTLNGKITLDSLTKYVHTTSGIRFAFNSEKVKGSQQINFTKGDYSIQQLLKQIKHSTSLYYSFYGGYVVFQDIPPKQSQIVGHSEHRQKTYNSTRNKKAVYKKDPAKSPSDRTAAKQQQAKTPLNKVQKQILVKQPIISTNAEQKKETVKTSANRKKSYAKNTIAENDSLPRTNKRKSLQIQVRSKAVVDTLIPRSPTVLTDRKPLFSSKPTTTINSNSAKRIKNSGAFHFGLQWNLPIPIMGTKSLLLSTSNRNTGAFVLLVPGIWLSRKIGKGENELVFTIKPLQHYTFGNKEVMTSITRTSPFDTAMIQKTISAIKTNTVYAALQYNYLINPKWKIGMGLHYNWQFASLLHHQTTQLLNNIVLTDSLYGIKNKSADWQYLKSSFFTGKVEVLYTIGKFDVGFTALLPTSIPLRTTLGNYRPINLHFLTRYRIQ